MEFKASNEKQLSKSKKMIDFTITACFILAVLAFMIEILALSEAISNEIVISIQSCLTSVIPSLFGFMVISEIIVKSNIYVIISKPFFLISRFIFRIRSELFSVFLLGNLAGYPIGAKTLATMVKNKIISKEDASEMICYSFSSGPAFIIGMIGVGIFSNAYVGFIIYISILSSNLLIGFLIGLTKKFPKRTFLKKRVKFSSNILINSVDKSAKSLLLICAMIIFFSIIVTVLDNLGIVPFIINVLGANPDKEHILKSLIEITQVGFIEKFSFRLLPYITASVAFGGLCVLTQIVAMTDSQFSLKKFILTRPVHMALSAAICHLLINKYAKHIVIMTVTNPIGSKQNGNILPSILLIIMIILLLSKKSVAISKKM